MEIIQELEREIEPLTSIVGLDEFTQIAQNCFDFTFDGINTFYPFKMPNIPKDYNLGVIIGGSGTGKSTLLKEFGIDKKLEWDKDKAIISHFNTPQEAIDRFNAVGLNSVPVWTKPYQVLSMGERFRASTARKIKDNAVIDEFTSVVDRNVAKSCSVSLSKYIKSNDIKNVVLCTCHKDILEWLEPDWVIDTDLGILYDGRSLRQPNIEISLYRTNSNSWGMFREYHYLTHNINKSARCYIAKWDENIIGFISILTQPSGSLKNAWREHRTVILPEYQGMGIGTKLSELMGEILLKDGCRFFSKTAHIRVGNHRESSKLWISTYGSKKVRDEEASKYNERGKNWKIDTTRCCWNHEYIGVESISKEHYNVRMVVENNNDCDIIEAKLLELKSKCVGENKYLIINVLTGKANYNSIDTICTKYGIRRENINNTVKYNEEYVF